MRIAIMAIAGFLFAFPAFAAETVTYTYDALGRLTKVVHTGTVNNGQQTDYLHDAADNRSSVTTTGAPH